MLEARNFVKSLDEAKKILSANNAVYKGEYKIHDIIYFSKDSQKTFADEFLRLRLVLKNIWDEKEVVVAIKNTEVKEIGKNSNIPLKKYFDTEGEAKGYIENNLLDKFIYSYEFDRMGWQYDLGDDQVDLEDIEGFLSIEVKSETEEGLKRLVNLFNMENILKGPSVVPIKELLKR
jgi:hypothetical protein